MEGCGGPGDAGSESTRCPSRARRPSQRAQARRFELRTDLVTIADCRLLARRNPSNESLETKPWMSSFSNFTAAAKKFSPKKHRERVGATSGKPCPLHDQERKRPCKQATNPRDLCPQFQPNRSRCARGHLPQVPLPARTARRALMHRVLLHRVLVRFPDPRRRRRRSRRSCGMMAPTTCPSKVASTMARARSTACRRRSTAA